MPTLKLRFPGGRYHATPWGHHVNEGMVEWPACPWRLLRALIACGFSSQGWMEIPPLGRELINKLAGVLPSYRLPEASQAHSRHFMPVGVFAKGREQTTLVFDTWANVGRGELLVHWDCDLSDEETELLRQLAGTLGYLGRSESWVEAELLDEKHLGTADFNAVPHEQGKHMGRDYEQVSLMAAIQPEAYAAWHQEVTEAALAELPLPTGKKKPSAKLQKDREKAIAPYPSDLLACLTKDTSWWKQHGWSQPPGSQRVLYWRRSDSLQVSVPRRTEPRPSRPVTTMLLSLTTPSGNRAALPPCRRTLPQAELFHRAIVGRLGKGHRVHCPELTGQDEDGKPLHDRHEHVHTIPVDLDGDGHLDHVLVHAKMTLGDAAQRAIRTLRRTWTKGGVGDIQVALVGCGDLEMLRKLPRPLDSQIRRILGSSEGSCVWRSITPFVPPRFRKPRGTNSLFGQVLAELASRQLPEVETVEFDTKRSQELRHFVRRRTHGGVPPPVDVGFALRLVFKKPVHGPLLLGYACHYGLGLFGACDD